MNFKKANIITGWVIFLIASVVYLSTIEPTTSFWDCGEFITTAFKLEIGHPPGAPLFMLLGALFAAFVPPSAVAESINMLSALSSSFTILFLFWTITHFGRKMAIKNSPDLDLGKIIAILASGAVGALAYTFSDSFWFSAVEGEVYALSALFTAATFWAILKWESLSTGRNELRWIILIAYLIGLSIGVHLLNLLAIPAICFVVYFKQNKPTTKGIIYTSLLSIAILGIIQSGIIPGVVSLAGKFELLFVNGFGLPFNTGTLIYALIVIGLIVYGLRYTRKKGKATLNTIILAVTMIILGYSTFAVIVIRSSANPPLDENNPENVFTLLSYLNREQYGDRPLLYGQYWNSPTDAENPRSDGDPVYTKAYVVANKTGKTIQWFSEEFNAKAFIKEQNNPDYHINSEYIISDNQNDAVINYDPKFEDPFPRMYSPQEKHINAYKSWSGYVGTPIRTIGNDGKPTIIRKPTFGENLKFFFRYQVNYMYWRYFMWNFAGRQNDKQGHGDLLNGNWLSGLNFIDNERLLSQDNLPESMTDNFAYNRFYLLPLILGLVGLLYQLYRRPKDWFVTLLLFIFTGLAIVVYLNQTPYQPRERDYAYAGSFYAFAIWIGLGVYALFDAAFNLSKKELIKAATFTLGAGVVVYLLEAMQSGSHYFSYSILYMGVIAIGLLALFFIIGKSLRNRAILAVLVALITIPVPILMAAEGWNDHDRSGRYTARDFAFNYLQSCEPNAILFTNGDNDTFPLWYAQEVEGVRTDVRVVNLSLLNTDWYINQMQRQVYNSEPVPFSLSEAEYRQGTRDVVFLDDSKNQAEIFVDVDNIMEYIHNDNDLRKTRGGDKISVLPTKTFAVSVDKEKILRNGIVDLADSAKIVDEVKWKIDRRYLLKNNLMQLDLLATNDWERPIYFAVTTGPDSYINLQDYFQLTGLAYHLTPIKALENSSPNTYGTVDTETMYDNVMNKFKWGGMPSENQIYMDENNIRMTNNIRLQFANLADELITQEKIEKARNVLLEALRVMPNHNVPYGRLMVPIIQNLYKIGENEKANEVLKIVFDRYADEFEYYLLADPEQALSIRREIQMSFSVIQRLNIFVTRLYPQGEFSSKISKRAEALDKAFDAKILEMEQYQSQPRGRF